MGDPHSQQVYYGTVYIAAGLSLMDGRRTNTPRQSATKPLTQVFDMQGRWRVLEHSLYTTWGLITDKK